MELKNFNSIDRIEILNNIHKLSIKEQFEILVSGQITDNDLIKMGYVLPDGVNAEDIPRNQQKEELIH